MILLKIFFNVWLVQKNYEWRKKNLAPSGSRCRILANQFGRILVGLCRIQQDSGYFGQINGQVLSDPVAFQLFWLDPTGFWPFWPNPPGI
jgi:hypothetical protein